MAGGRGSRSMIRRACGAAVVVALAVSLSGCGGSSGGGDSSSPPTTTASAPPTKAAYLTEANAICAGMNSTAIDLSKDYGSKPDTPENQASALRANADLIDATVTQLRALPRPEGDEATLESAYDRASELSNAARPRPRRSSRETRPRSPTCRTLATTPRRWPIGPPTPTASRPAAPGPRTPRSRSRATPRCYSRALANRASASGVGAVSPRQASVVVSAMPEGPSVHVSAPVAADPPVR